MRKKIVSLLIIIGLIPALSAQEPAEIEVKHRDSVRFSLDASTMPDLMVESAFMALPFFLPDFSVVNPPVFDFSKDSHSGWTIHRSGMDSFFPGISMAPFSGSFSLPFPGTGTVFNQASYRINEKWIFGGNSYGMNLFPWAPGAGRGMNQWNFRGASMFMEYKVAKNVRIGAGVSVNGSNIQP